MVYLVNLTEKDYARKKNKWLKKIADWVFVRPPPPTSARSPSSHLRDPRLSPMSPSIKAMQSEKSTRAGGFTGPKRNLMLCTPWPKLALMLIAAEYLLESTHLLAGFSTDLHVQLHGYTAVVLTPCEDLQHSVGSAQGDSIQF